MKKQYKDRDDAVFDFDKLKLVEKPNATRNTGQNLPMNLEGCDGYLESLPLKPPNANQKDMTSIANMINVLTNPESLTAFGDAEANLAQPEALREGTPSSIYDPSSNLVKRLSKRASTAHAGAPGMMGHIVRPGCISFYEMDGKTYAVPQGRWLLISYKARWTDRNVSVDRDEIRSGQVLIIRIPPGAVGRIFDQGVPSLLAVGTHVFNSGNVKNAGTIVYANNPYFSHDKFRYVRVQRGKYAKVWAMVSSNGNKAMSPRLLGEGEHFIESHLFEFKGLVDISTKYIHHGSIHVVSVIEGEVSKITQDNHPRILGEGTHFIESVDFEYRGEENIIETLVIQHATITIVRVTLGKVALAWKDNTPFFIDEPGLYEYNSPDFKFVEFKDADDSLIQLGSRKIVLVHTGTVGVTYDNGNLKILDHGRHTLDSATHVFHRFLSTQQKSIRLSSQTAEEKAMRSKLLKQSKKAYTQTRQTMVSDNLPKSIADPDSDLTICETKDLVKVGLRADVFYSIEDPEKCINKIETDELEDLVRETAVATLTNIIRSTALNEIAQSKQVSAGGETGGLKVMPAPGVEEEEEQGGRTTTAFFEKAHDEFLDKLHDDFMSRYGVDIANIRIESFKIMDTELADQISKHALTTAQIENEMANLEGNSLISTTKERTAADVLNINALAKAEALQTKANADNRRMIEAAEAAAKAMRIESKARAEAESEAILEKARAEAEAIRLKAVAEAERAELLSQTKLGMQEALLSLYSNIVVESNKGVEKIIYMDPSVNRDSPFAIGSLQNLNYDLHSLSQMGVAAEHAGGSAPSNGAIKKSLSGGGNGKNRVVAN
mmetsp:Transcript_8747/g.25154  ORF Transcript_8747/g.25154 Transcript_8747/m.25154 type:complete len:834 (+) Transcript_8747:149-2650(+)|eukprot:CAMPEP_0119562784 /NCGR_PEP_ID=MMETSP1352-20130426/21527_1 /TAXON_ID=265584 /ORGANISM="Stauroneis constricta, Strain CCMP1120" /LENGTH=833 /DNA_ID=CAMNT_0007611259 /DNA_START=59 /DNA_END=2560 /DNA_ORIENTATION=+